MTSSSSRLYTRSGDDGTTGLFGGGRVAKDHPRVDAYGCVDELNAAIGLAAAEAVRLRAALPANGSDATAAAGQRDFLNLALHIFADLQSRLFDIGADLATPEDAPAKHESKILRIGEAHVLEAERWIDDIDAGNLPMRQFVMPGGTELAARLHLARTICRRAERAIVSLQRTEKVTPGTLRYINRVSDLLFTMARRANREAGSPDVPWTPGGRGRDHQR